MPSSIPLKYVLAIDMDPAAPRPRSFRARAKEAIAASRVPADQIIAIACTTLWAVTANGLAVIDGTCLWRIAILGKSAIRLKQPSYAHRTCFTQGSEAVVDTCIQTMQSLLKK